MSGEERELPAGWAWATLGDITTITSGIGFPPTLQGRPDGDYPFAKVGDISRVVRAGEIFIDSAPNFINEENVKQLRAHPLPKGTIIFAKIGESIGLNYRAITSRAMLVDNNVMAILADAQLVEIAYIYYKLRTMDFYPLAVATSVPSLRKTDLEVLPVPVPPLPEQRRIVAKLDALSARSRRAREALAAVPKLLERLRQSILASAFRGDLTADWRAQNPDVEPASELLKRIRAERRQKWEEVELAKLIAKGKRPKDDAWKAKYQEPAEVDPEGLPKLPESWASVQFNTIINELRNGMSPRPNGESGLPVLRINAVRASYVDLNAVRYFEEPPDAWETYVLQHNDLLFTRYNGTRDFVGVCGMVRSPSVTSVYPDKLIRVRLQSLIVPDFIEYAFSSAFVRSQVDAQLKTSAGQVGISGGELKQINILLPPLSEQQRIVDLLKCQLETIARLENHLRASIAELDNLDRSILAKAFRGELVAQDPSDEPASVLLERIRQEREAGPAEARRGRKRAKAEA